MGGENFPLARGAWGGSLTPLERSPQVQRPIRPGVHLHDDTPTPFHVHMRSFLFPRLHHDACKPSSCAHDRARSRTMRVRERPRPRLAIAMFKVVKFNVINFIVTASDLGRVRMCHGLRRCGTLGLHVHFEPLEHRAHARALLWALRPTLTYEGYDRIAIGGQLDRWPIPPTGAVAGS